MPGALGSSRTVASRAPSSTPNARGPRRHQQHPGEPPGPSPSPPYPTCGTIAGRQPRRRNPRRITADTRASIRRPGAGDRCPPRRASCAHLGAPGRPGTLSAGRRRTSSMVLAVGGLVVAERITRRSAAPGRRGSGSTAAARRRRLDDLPRPHVVHPVVALVMSRERRSARPASRRSSLGGRPASRSAGRVAGPRWTSESEPLRRPEPSSTARTTRSRVCTGFTLTQPRRAGRRRTAW